MGAAPRRTALNLWLVLLPAILDLYHLLNTASKKNNVSAAYIAWRSILNSSISTLSQSPSSALSSQRAAFSTSKNDKPQKTPPSPGNPSSGNPSYPAFSFEGLGANRTIKVTVIACLTVVGTIESIFWAKVLWAKMSKSPRRKRRTGRHLNGRAWP